MDEKEKQSMNPIRMMLEMSPDRKITWFVILIGTIKMFNLDKWIPIPDDPEQIITLVKYGNQEVQELSEQIRQQVSTGGDSMFSMLSIFTAIVYVVGKKAKEWKATISK